MRTSLRFLVCAAVFAIPFLVTPVDAARSSTELAQFGGAVLVGDGEVFAAESNNQFRPGIVYVYRKNGASWTEAMQLMAPKPAVSDGFGSSMALDGSTLFIGAGPSAVHIF